MTTAHTLEPSARVYSVHLQLPLHSDTKVAVSLAAVVMLPRVGRIRLVALYVRSKAPANRTFTVVQAVVVPKEVIVIVPVMCTKLPVAAPKSTVLAEAKSTPLASFTCPVKVSHALFALAVLRVV